LGVQQNKQRNFQAASSSLNYVSWANLLASWESDSCSSSNQVLRVRESRFVFRIESKSGETIKFWKKTSETNTHQKGWRWDKKLAASDFIPYQGSFKGGDPRETQKDTNRSWQTERQTDTERNRGFCSEI
jgi:hypothetical protein